MTKLTRLTNSKLSLKKQVLVQRFWHNTVLINVALAGVLVLFGLGYLGIVNSTAQDTFAVASLSRRIDDTENQNQRLELDISEVLALPHVSAKAEHSHLVAAASVHYLNDSSAVALSQ
jgi:hypothetical protein